MFIKECVFNKCVDRKSIKFQRSVLVNTPLSIKYNETLKALLPVYLYEITTTTQGQIKGGG